MKKLIVLTINLITPYFLYLLAVNVRDSYGYVLWIPILGALILLNIYAFISHTKKYPLNDYKEYEFKSFIDLVDDIGDGQYAIVIEKKGNTYFTISGTKQLKFEMKGCLFPENYIRAYFIRNIHFNLFNKQKRAIIRIGSSFKVSDKFKFSNLVIKFNDKKERTFWLVKKSKTKVYPLFTEIIGIPFWYYGIGPRGRLGQHIRVTEMDYVNFKRVK